MAKFLKFYENKFLYNLSFTILLIFLFFISFNSVNAETKNYTLSDSTLTNLGEIEISEKQVYSQTLISFWQEKYSSTYPYYYIHWSAPFVNLYMFKEIPTLTLSSKKYNLILPAQNKYLYYYDNSVQEPTATNQIPREIFNTSTYIFSYDNYVISNFELKSTIDFSFVYDDKFYTYAIGDVIPTMLDFYNSKDNVIEPEEPVVPDDTEYPNLANFFVFINEKISKTILCFIDNNYILLCIGIIFSFCILNFIKMLFKR